MHHDVGICWIGHGELSVPLPLRYEREHATQPAARWCNGRAGELDRAVGRLLLVTVAEVRLKDAALRRHRLREVFDSYMRVPSETTASVSSPTDDDQSSRRWGRDRCIAGAVRAGAARSRCRGAAALLSVAKHEPRPSVRCAAIFARMTGSNRRAHASPAAGGAWEQQVSSRYAGPARSRKQASAGPTRDAWFATHSAISPRPGATASPGRCASRVQADVADVALLLSTG